jgi:hypothetical protein
MSISDAYVEVECDGCHTVEVVTLTAIAWNCWDERNVKDHMKSMGWSITEDGDYCEDCKTHHPGG